MKTESVRNRTVCNDLDSNRTSATPKIMRQIGGREEFIY